MRGEYDAVAGGLRAKAWLGLVAGLFAAAAAAAYLVYRYVSQGRWGFGAVLLVFSVSGLISWFRSLRRRANRVEASGRRAASR